MASPSSSRVSSWARAPPPPHHTQGRLPTILNSSSLIVRSWQSKFVSNSMAFPSSPCVSSWTKAPTPGRLHTILNSSSLIVRSRQWRFVSNSMASPSSSRVSSWTGARRRLFLSSLGGRFVRSLRNWKHKNVIKRQTQALDGFPLLESHIFLYKSLKPFFCLALVVVLTGFYDTRNIRIYEMSYVTRKPVFGVCDQAGLKPAGSSMKTS